MTTPMGSTDTVRRDVGCVKREQSRRADGRWVGCRVTWHLYPPKETAYWPVICRSAEEAESVLRGWYGVGRLAAETKPNHPDAEAWRPRVYWVQPPVAAADLLESSVPTDRGGAE